MLALLVWLLSTVLYQQTFDAGIHAGDFKRALDAAKSLADGQSEYVSPPGEVGYVYTPLVALALRPLAKAPVEQVIHLWFFVCVLSLLLSVGLYAKASGIALHEAAPLGIMLIAGFFYRPTSLDFSHGQFNLPVLALLCGAYLADSQNRPFVLATCIVAAALIKIWFLGLLFYLLVRRRPWAFAWGFLLFGICTTALFSVVGASEALAYPQKIVQFLTQDAAYGFKNQSILGFARVHFGPNPDATPLRNDPLILHGMVALGFLAVLAGLFYAHRREPGCPPQRLRLLMGLTVISLLLVLPFCERPYFVFLLPIFWTLLTSDTVPALARAAAVGIYVVFTFPFSTPGRSLHSWKSLTPSAFFLATALLWVVVVLLIMRRDESEEPPAWPADWY